MFKIAGAVLIFTAVNTTVLIWSPLIIIIKVIMYVNDWVRPSAKIRVSRYGFFIKRFLRLWSSQKA